MPLPATEHETHETPEERWLTIECSVTRKVVRNYNSTEYHVGARIDIGERSPEDAAAATFERLRQMIRAEFARGGNNDAGS